MIALTQQQVQELQDGGWPPKFFDPASQHTFVLLPAEMYQRILPRIEEEEEMDAVEEMYPLVSEVLEKDDLDSAKESA